MFSSFAKFKEIVRAIYGINNNKQMAIRAIQNVI